LPWESERVFYRAGARIARSSCCCGQQDERAILAPACYLGQSNKLEPGSPVHLVVHNSSLYVSGGDHIYTALLSSSPDKFVLKAINSVKVKNSCGMAFGNSGNFYVA